MGVSHGPGLVVGGSQGIGEGMVGAPDTAIPLRLGASSNIAASAATATTNRLTLPGGKTFQAGKISDDTNPFPSIDPGADVFVELEVSIDPVAVANGEVYEFFVYNNDTPLDSVTNTPQWTIGSVGGYDPRVNSFFMSL